MIKPTKSLAVTSNKFDLKNTKVELLRPSRGVAKVGVAELEAMRDGAVVTASKHGLEVICGASCETGAQ